MDVADDESPILELNLGLKLVEQSASRRRRKRPLPPEPVAGDLGEATRPQRAAREDGWVGGIYFK
jgi:hypothetical protein